MDHKKTAAKEKKKKSLPATYEPDIRTSGWLKLKKDYVDGMSDSLDVIPIGGWHGNGRKARWWSPVLLALWDPEAGHPVAVCKCMSGKCPALIIQTFDIISGFCVGFTDAFYTVSRIQRPSRFRQQHVNSAPLVDEGTIFPRI
jgi:hypothetical protein